MRTSITVLLFLFTVPSLFSQVGSTEYLGQKAPGDTPEIFAPGIITKENQSEFGSVFSADGKEFFYAIDEDGKAEIWCTKLQKGVWTKPKAIISHPIYSFNDPFLSPDEQKLYYISDRSMTGEDEKKDYDIWYSTREENGWSEPFNAGNTINTESNEYYISFTDDGSMYFSSNTQAEEGRSHDFDIYKSTLKSGHFQKPVKLSDSINTKRYEADVFVAPDESYIIFSTARKDGMGKGDLYISFKNTDNSWSEAKNMGTDINTEGHELCPFVTKDGKFFFFTSNQDIYWVDAEILKKFR
ncbi:PD40 domain-containing protein [Marivirga sp. S37H4]|uniref:PD40 domain-containing protein n=1 Tax=Marivirga aurantiaca TaxID=2802615 RepID=A0A934WZH0_9BACT|nr:PD40 domain-containing protein [Marivirga aurantiaca]MBK6265665.1 PD40 domain-containing protein [Marivirga aurantiaca]